ncbi:hypothetical protein L9F63_004981, partial [Diploptera punctata]
LYWVVLIWTQKTHVRASLTCIAIYYLQMTCDPSSFMATSFSVTSSCCIPSSLFIHGHFIICVFLWCIPSSLFIHGLFMFCIFLLVLFIHGHFNFYVFLLPLHSWPLHYLCLPLVYSFQPLHSWPLHYLCLPLV